MQKFQGFLRTAAMTGLLKAEQRSFKNSVCEWTCTRIQPPTGDSVPVKPWKLEADDTALVDLIPFLEYVARHPPADIRPVLASYQGRDIATEFIERSKADARTEAAWPFLAALSLE
ncbi:hypothetical protein RHMOL_Rhmol06G0245300 [Rhododendron molle]|uniref:Uncharacterized protein n=1 Tax=Rhododendron molle TaxID=49168 RepID=A0ACC0NG56_RHOML|nr:hypothetical protein RHMOL_Rhmol06G0245300 [Rhododendron molle]